MPSRLLLLVAALFLLPIAPAQARGPDAARELRVPEAFRGRAPRRGVELRVPRGFRPRMTEARLQRERRADLRDPWSRGARGPRR